MSFLVMQEKTSIWVLNKEKWIQGPKITHDHTNDVCMVALNSSSVILFNSQTSLALVYNFESMKLITEILIDVNDSTYLYCSGISTIDKNRNM